MALLRSTILQRGRTMLTAFYRRLGSNYKDPGRISCVDMTDSGLLIQLNVNGSEKTHKLPYVYLRDNSQNPDLLTHSRQDRHLFDANIQATNVQTSDHGQQLIITWPDERVSYYPLSWLLQHLSGSSTISGRLPVERELWTNNSFESTLMKYDFDDLMSSDSRLLDCLIKLESCGIILVENAGLEPRRALSLSDRIAYPKPVVYGYDVMKLEVKPNASSLAYTNVQIPLHTDMPYCEYVPGILFLHCIHQVKGDGGRTMCSDGFHVAEELRIRSPSAFEMLSRYPIQFGDAADDYVGHNIDAMQKPIRLDCMGDIVAIRHNNGVRGSRFPSELMDRLYDWYDAYYKFSHLMYDPKYLVEFKLQPGQIAMFDNTRILHGRSRFDLGEGVYRYLEEVYLDWDEARSKARVIMGKNN